MTGFPRASSSDLWERPSTRAAQKVAHLFVGGWGEVFVPEADRVEGLGRGGADHLVRDCSHVLADVGGCDGYRCHDLLRLFAAESVDGYPHRRSGGQTIVDQDNRASFDGERRAPA